MRVEIADDTDELAPAAADLLATLLTTAPATFGLAGGSTPIATYHILAGRDLDWSRITCWLPDERWVPLDDVASNSLMARTALTDRTGAVLLAPDTTVESPSDAAATYQLDLETVLPGATGIVLLGVGADGHTASLFPGTDALDVVEAAYVANWVEGLGAWRLTATASLLQAADHIVFLASGAAKAPVLRSILVDEEPYPARLVAEGARDVTWLLDAAAAALL
jgi:6-phosphogluconolactonase